MNFLSNDPSKWAQALQLLGATLQTSGAGFSGRQNDALPNLLNDMERKRTFAQLQNSVLGQPSMPTPGVNITPQTVGAGALSPGMQIPPSQFGGGMLGLPDQINGTLRSLPPEVA